MLYVYMFECLKGVKYQYGGGGGVVICYTSDIIEYDRRRSELSNEALHMKQEVNSMELKVYRKTLPFNPIRRGLRRGLKVAIPDVVLTTIHPSDDVINLRNIPHCTILIGSFATHLATNAGKASPITSMMGEYIAISALGIPYLYIQIA